MTARQVVLMVCLYVVALSLVVFFTRATARRIAGALTGGVAASVVALGGDALGQALGLWRMAIWGPHILPLVCLGFAVSLAPIYLVTWRVARRFGLRGLVVAVAILTVIGPPRDYLYMSRFPEWGSYAQGLVPVLAIAALYAMLVPVGHSVMRWVAGPARADRLASRPWVR